MQKLAARDFEDLLQVWTTWLLDNIAYHMHTVRPPSLRGPTPHAERKQLTQDTLVRPCYVARLCKAETTH